MEPLSHLPRVWPTIGIPGIANRMATYWMVDLDAMPSIAAGLDGTLAWLLETPAHAGTLVRGPDDPVEREANAEGLRAISDDRSLPKAFRQFIESPEPRRHIRSATACYLDLGHFSVGLTNGGRLIHFLSDQQWVLHWLLYVGPDGSEAVLTTWKPFGFDDGEEEPIRELEPERWTRSLAVCADSFEEFLYRFWAMNELFFRLGVDRSPLDALPAELRKYAAAYPRVPSTIDLFAEAG